MRIHSEEKLLSPAVEDMVSLGDAARHGLRSIMKVHAIRTASVLSYSSKIDAFPLP